jgi:hypothetical protein
MMERKTGGGNPRQQSRLFELPKLTDAKAKFEIPNFDPTPTPRVTGCAGCGRSLRNDADFCQSVKVCREYLRVYAVIGDALNRHGEQNAIEAKRKSFIRKLNFGDVI